MGKIIATCCHEITSEWMSDERSRVHLKTSDTVGNPAVSLEVLCPECREAREEDGLLLESEVEIDAYLEIFHRLWEIKPSIAKGQHGEPVVDLEWGGNPEEPTSVLSMSVRDAREMAREIIKLTDAHTSLS